MSSRPYRRDEVARWWRLAVSGWERQRCSGCDVIASLPQRGEGEVGDEPGPEGGGDEAGDGEGFPPGGKGGGRAEGNSSLLMGGRTRIA